MPEKINKNSALSGEPAKQAKARKSASSAGASRKKSRHAASLALPAFKDVRALIMKCPRALRLAIADILMIGIGLLIFAYFHHVRVVAYSTDHVVQVPRPTKTVLVPTDAPTAAPTEIPVTTEASVSAPAETPAPTETPTEAPTATPDPGDWGTKFADKFTDGKIELTDNSYRSDKVSITITKTRVYDENGNRQVWFVADIYLENVDLFRTAFAEDTYGQGYSDWIGNTAEENNAILAINGDFYGAREKGIVIRNGFIYRTEPFKDVCVLYYDGVMETYSAQEFDLDAAILRGAYQAFSFGPGLLDENGKAKETYDSEIVRSNPRTAIGYFEPGHYCFVVADGRQDGYSKGLTMQALAKIFEDLGCKAAYNLDGGETAAMFFDGNRVNKPCDGGREVSDIVYIGEAEQ